MYQVKFSCFKIQMLGKYIFSVLSISLSSYFGDFSHIHFLKHYLGNWLGIQDYYCNNGYSCKSQRPSKYTVTQNALILESIAEGGLFLLFGTVLMNIQKNMIVTYFLIGALLHLSFEISGVHQKIYSYRCKRP